MKKYLVKINAPLNYIRGYLRYGHFEGEVELTEEEFKQFESDPETVFKDLELRDCLKLKVDGWSIEDWGDVMEVNYKVMSEMEDNG